MKQHRRSVWAAVRRAAMAAVLVAGCGAAVPTPSPVAPTPTVSPAPTATPTLRPTPVASATPTASPSPTIAPTYAMLDGVAAPADLADRLPVAYTIDDNVAARPQSGFNAASIVYQAPADGGEDRYMLVFQQTDAPDVGPVRSGRPYFVNWAAEYRAAFAHFGGDAKTLAYVPTLHNKLIYNVDALVVGQPEFHRISSRPRPHNAYSSAELVRAYAERRGAPAAVAGIPIRAFKDDAPAATRPASGSITVPYNRGAAGYTYDPGLNAYLRSVAGKPSIDEADGQRVIARNVVVLFMRLSIDPESERGYRRPVLDQIGSGKAMVFRDGTAVVGTWRKDDVGDLTRFYDADGVEVALNRGRIFVQVVATGTDVGYEAPEGR